MLENDESTKTKRLDYFKTSRSGKMKGFHQTFRDIEGQNDPFILSISHSLGTRAISDMFSLLNEAHFCRFGCALLAMVLL